MWKGFLCGADNVSSFNGHLAASPIPHFATSYSSPRSVKSRSVSTHPLAASEWVTVFSPFPGMPSAVIAVGRPGVGESGSAPWGKKDYVGGGGSAWPSGRGESRKAQGLTRPLLHSITCLKRGDGSDQHRFNGTTPYWMHHCCSWD